MKHCRGDLAIGEWKPEYGELESVSGDLDIGSEAKLDKLETVGGHLDIYSEAKLDKLETVGGYLIIHSEAKLDSPQLKTVGGYLIIHSEAKLDSLETIGGDLYIHSEAKLDKLETVGGDLYIHSPLSKETEDRLWKKHPRNTWRFNEDTSQNLLGKKHKRKQTIYHISGIEFEKPDFDKIRKGEITPHEVFAYRNIEQRRIAYEHMPKQRMTELPTKTFDMIEDDGYGNPMKIIAITVKDYKKPFKYLQCTCPSTGRQYLLETLDDTCHKAKARSFGLNQIKFKKEW